MIYICTKQLLVNKKSSSIPGAGCCHRMMVCLYVRWRAVIDKDVPRWLAWYCTVGENTRGFLSEKALYYRTLQLVRRMYDWCYGGRKGFLIFTFAFTRPGRMTLYLSQNWTQTWTYLFVARVENAPCGGAYSPKDFHEWQATWCSVGWVALIGWKTCTNRTHNVLLSRTRILYTYPWNSWKKHQKDANVVELLSRAPTSAICYQYYELRTVVIVFGTCALYCIVLSSIWCMKWYFNTTDSMVPATGKTCRLWNFASSFF